MRTDSAIIERKTSRPGHPENHHDQVNEEKYQVTQRQMLQEKKMLDSGLDLEIRQPHSDIEA